MSSTNIQNDLEGSQVQGQIKYGGKIKRDKSLRRKKKAKDKEPVVTAKMDDGVYDIPKVRGPLKGDGSPAAEDTLNVDRVPTARDRPTLRVTAPSGARATVAVAGSSDANNTLKVDHPSATRNTFKVNEPSVAMDTLKVDQPSVAKHDRLSFSDEARCHSVADLPPEDFLYEEYMPPYAINRPLPSTIKMADFKARQSKANEPSGGGRGKKAQLQPKILYPVVEDNIYDDVEVKPLSQGQQPKSQGQGRKKSAPREIGTVTKEPLPLVGFGAMNPEPKTPVKKEDVNFRTVQPQISPPRTKYISQVTSTTSQGSQSPKPPQGTKPRTTNLDFQIETLTASPRPVRRQISQDVKPPIAKKKKVPTATLR